MKRWMGIVLVAIILSGCGASAAGHGAAAPAGPASHTSAGTAGSATLAAIKKRGVLDYAWATWFPYAYRDPKTNQVRGIAIDVARQLATSMGVRLHLVQATWSTIVAGLQANRYDVTMPLIENPARAKAAAFAAPLMTNAYTAAVLKSNLKRFPNVAALDHPGVTVAVTLGANSDNVAKQYLKHASLAQLQSDSDTILSVVSGRTDAVFSGNDELAFVVQKYPQLAELPGAIGHQLIRLAVAKGEPHFIQWLDAWTAHVKSDGQLKGWIVKHGLTGAFVAG